MTTTNHPAQKFSATMALPAFYLVVCAHKDCVYSSERTINLAGQKDEWRELVDDIWSGQFTELLKVIRVDVAAGTSEDLTADMADELSRLSRKYEQEPDSDVCGFIDELGGDYWTAPEQPLYRRPSQWGGWY